MSSDIDKTVIENPENPKLKLDQSHKKLKLNCGDFTEEYPEQEMSVMYIKPII
jgi:hypothetical protein